MANISSLLKPKSLITMLSKKEQIAKIVKLECKKHIRIYKLSKLGLSNKEVAEALGTNTGHVYNALKLYQAKPELKKIADSNSFAKKAEKGKTSKEKSKPSSVSKETTKKISKPKETEQKAEVTLQNPANETAETAEVEKRKFTLLPQSINRWI